ncbi:MAG: anaerobic ribonucleoside-triphosphate reductase [Spirochaetota bacterium]
MDVREAKRAKLAELKANLMTVEGTPTEVYSRIVGYYRSVRNWNAGKREEFGRRREYAFPGTVPAVPQGIYSGAFTASAFSTSQRVHSTETSEIETGLVASYLLFTRKSCPNCPPVATAIEVSGISGHSIDVDTGEGMALASGHAVLATPTVILLDANKREVGRAFTRPQLLTLLAPVRETVLA